MGYLYIEKKNGERFGSQIQSIKNALYVAFHLNMNIKIGTNHLYTNKNELPYIPEVIRLNDSSSNEVFHTHNFFNISVICAETKINADAFKKNHPKVIQKLRECIKLPEPTKSASNDLYIHMRSGDIFHKPGWKWSNFYIPPPLIYYNNAITERSWREIYIICEDAKNPCLSALLNKYPQIKWRQQSLVEDIKLILGARNIVYGGGTFIPSLLEFNRSVQLIYRVDYSLIPVSPAILYRIYNSYQYIKALGGEYSNLPAQQFYMINFGFRRLKDLKLK